MVPPLMYKSVTELPGLRTIGRDEISGLGTIVEPAVRTGNRL